MTEKSDPLQRRQEWDRIERAQRQAMSARNRYVWASLLLFVAVLVAYSQYTQWSEAKSSVSWPQVEADLIVFEMSYECQSTDNAIFYTFMCTPDVDYRYVFEGTEYKGKRVILFGKPHWDVLSERFEQGSTIKVSVNPNDPGTSVMMTGFTTKFGGLATMVTNYCFGGIVLILWLVALADYRRKKAHPDLSRQHDLFPEN